jgi:cytochrome c
MPGMKLLAPMLLVLATGAIAADERQLAADKGCYNCHGEPPRRNVPSFRELAQTYSAYRGRLDAAAERKLADRLHHGSAFSHVAAHERLTEDEAHRLIRWLVAGAP